MGITAHSKLMEKIKNNPDMLKLGGERKRISVLFSDIVGFTSFTDAEFPDLNIIAANWLSPRSMKKSM